MSEICKVCRIDKVHAEAPAGYGICTPCTMKLGVRPLPPSRRPPTPCSKCNAMVFKRVVPREYTASGKWGGDYISEHVGPMTLTYAVPIVQQMTHNEVGTTDIEFGYGTIEAYVCIKCGFVEWYCLDPDRIPIGSEYMSELVDYAGETPYR
jgi:hypothetical protein